MIEMTGALLLVLVVLAFRWWSLERDLRLRRLPREERLQAAENSPWLAGLVLTASLTALAWEWSRDRSLAAWRPGYGEVLFLIVAPAVCWAALKRLLHGPVDWWDPRLQYSPAWLPALALGFLNAWALGVWERVSPELLRSPGIWILVVVVGSITGALVVAVRRDRARQLSK